MMFYWFRHSMVDYQTGNRLQLISERQAKAQNAWSEWRQKHITTDPVQSPVDILIWELVESLVESPSDPSIEHLRGSSNKDFPVS